MKVYGLTLDDWSINNDPDLNWGWTQICASCAQKLTDTKGLTPEGEGHGICGVVGCSNDSDHYVDFDKPDTSH